VDIETMPYLLDHCFFKQRTDWPDVSDRFPVVPATTVIQHMMDAAESSSPGGTHAIAVHGARFDRWTAAIPPVDIDISTAPENGAPERIKVGFGSYARSTVEVARAYPAAPEPWPVDAASERPAHITAAQLYDDRWMFHGPRFQALTELTALGGEPRARRDHRARGTRALLDNVGQLLGYWIMTVHEHRTVVFPVGMRGSPSTVHRRPRAPGWSARSGSSRSTTCSSSPMPSSSRTAGSGPTSPAGPTAASAATRTPAPSSVRRAPRLLAHAQPGGWVAVFDRWSDPASRDLRMRSYLSAVERADYEARSPRGRGQWLLGRVAARTPRDGPCGTRPAPRDRSIPRRSTSATTRAANPSSKGCTAPTCRRTASRSPTPARSASRSSGPARTPRRAWASTSSRSCRGTTGRL
jgi:hypothetical protein